MTEQKQNKTKTTSNNQQHKQTDHRQTTADWTGWRREREIHDT